MYILKKQIKCYKVKSKVLKANGALTKNCGNADGFWRIGRTGRFLMRAIHFRKRQHHLYLVL